MYDTDGTRGPDPAVPTDRVIAPGPGGRYRGEYEIRVLDFTRDVTKSDMRRRLTEDAEYGHWELFRTRIYVGGRRRTWLRRKIIRARY
ncbi:DUF5703 family protein [Nostocoides sp. F2B08]|uniref:DUF5703 family protein n=1 Tax=Nostocoides sp. F2B08 TaxID=2653936 RepID=UPI00351A91C5